MFRTLLLAVAAGAATAGAQTPAAPPPIEHFFENPVFTGAALSPTAQFLAVRIGAPDTRERLAVVDLRNNSVQVVAQFRDADIGDFRWISEQRLVFDSTDNQIGQADVDFGPGLYAVNRDGSDFRQLANRSGEIAVTPSSASRRQLLPWHTFLMEQLGAQDSDSIYVTSTHYDSRFEVAYVNLLRLDTKTGLSSIIVRPGNTRSWMLDHRGEPRIATTLDKNISAVHYRDPATGEWRKLVEFDAYKGGQPNFTPLAFGPDGTFYVLSRGNDDKTSVYPYDLAAGKIRAAPLVSLQGYDFSGSLITDNGRLLGVRHLTDAEATTWFDPAMQTLQKQVDALLPATINLITPAARPDTPNVLVESYSDRQPRSYALFDTANQTLNKVGDSHPAIQPAQMGSEQLVHYKARDGLDIPAWLTLPGSGAKKNLPMVVLVHGGPYVRGHSWGWDAEVQFLASRGYAVLQPEFRGSTGFGARHYRAGWKQWGLKMQDDIADGAKWAIAQGIAAPQRICIAGASYGGYATLMGLVNDPQLYQCGINWVGVTDINLMYTGHWSFTSDMTEGWKRYGMPDLIGDPVKDAAQLAATSPLLQAARIKQPLLLAYGAADMRVPLYHGNKFRDAVKAGNKDVEWVVYDEEGHGWALPKNRIDFWGRVEKFLARNIGKP
ncbi:alpha/beta hydrolase family protein [Janthinobacterium fluminis]|uniref:Prolyl oligopeptidase family serine peptidase n=1 Tax=Janthinobacterium fluminis TaxID=2987524 RepID=A0ABT5K3N7_9BURK|nr:alpha/beta fold hydrolase [Janthinobacterium fluminis]MDC8759603.1 prolyl oligopeptidase family serine peptidase [Janthinobacterium fluminis]